MIGLRSQFGPSIAAAIVATLLAGTVAVVVWRRARSAGKPSLAPVARVLAVGAGLVTVIATALPRDLAIQTDGDLVWQLGRGGLGGWRVLAEDPSSLAAIELVGNVTLYGVLACLATLGWWNSRRWVVPVCLALSVLIETAQYLVLGRVGALDDVVLNGGGALMGYGIAMLLMRYRAAAPRGRT